MSPEQAEMTCQDIDTRSDIYSLGAILYELLTGILPFESDTLRQGPDYLRQIVCEPDPQTPSARLSKLTPEDSTRIANYRQVDGGMLRRTVDDESQWRLTIWNPETGEMRRQHFIEQPNLGRPRRAAISPDGRRLAAGSSGRETVKLWETVTWQEVLTLAGEGTMFRFVAFSPDGQTLMARNDQGLLHIWSAPSLDAIEKANAPPSQTR